MGLASLFHAKFSHLSLSIAISLAVASSLLPLASANAASGTDGVCTGAGANPWVYNFEVNGYPAKVINDLIFEGPVEPGFFAPGPVVSRALRRRFENDTIVHLDNNILYIDIDGEGVLVDAGNGQPTPTSPIPLFGLLFGFLESEGIPRSSIKHILLTHGHPDHLGGLVEDTEGLEPAFPEATVHISRIEHDYWTTEPVDNGTSLLPPDFIAGNIMTAQAVLGAVEDQIKTFEMHEEPLPGFKPIPTPWHTKGSVAYAIKDGEKTLAFTGDGLPHKILSIENPWITFLADWMPETGAEGRYDLLDTAVREEWQLLGGHASFPGLLNVEHEGANFRSTAAPYQGSAAAMSVCT